MSDLLVFVIVMMTLVAALSALILPNFLAATAATTVVSLGVAVMFVLLQAPDVAMTEAVVGVGLSALILALGLKRLGLWQLDLKADKEDAD